MKRKPRDQLVTFQRASESSNSLGEPVQTWADICDAMAAVAGIRGTERFSALQVRAEVDHRFWTDWRPDLADLSPKDRIVHNGRAFDIASVVNIDERNMDLEIVARLRV